MDTEPRSDVAPVPPEGADRLFVPLSEVPPDSGDRFLIERLIVREGFYFLVGHPKVGKSTMLTELAVAIASGMRAFGKLEVAGNGVGPVMYVAAEDRASYIKARATLVGEVRGAAANRLDDIHVCTDRRFRLDDRLEMDRLEREVQRVKPVALFLDSFGRLHGGDERSSSAMTSVLERLLLIQQTHRLTVIMVHHIVKNTVASGSSIRGSSALWAVADGCIAVNRGTSVNEVVVTAEHRYAPPYPAMLLERSGDPSYLTFTSEHAGSLEAEPAKPDLAQQIEACLAAAGKPMSVKEIAKTVHRRHEDVGHSLWALERSGKIFRSRRGQWELFVPVPGLDADGSGSGAVGGEDEFAKLMFVPDVGSVPGLESGDGA